MARQSWWPRWRGRFLPNNDWKTLAKTPLSEHIGNTREGRGKRLGIAAKRAKIIANS
jgi:hypothetical protein